MYTSNDPTTNWVLHVTDEFISPLGQVCGQPLIKHPVTASGQYLIFEMTSFWGSWGGALGFIGWD